MLLDARGKRWFVLLVRNEDLLVTRIGLEKYAGLTPAKDTVEDSQLSLISGVAAQLADNLYSKRLLPSLLHPAEFLFRANVHEIISVHNTSEISIGMLKATGAGEATDESDSLKLGRQNASQRAGASRVP